MDTRPRKRGKLWEEVSRNSARSKTHLSMGQTQWVLGSMPTRPYGQISSGPGVRVPRPRESRAVSAPPKGSLPCSFWVSTTCAPTRQLWFLLTHLCSLQKPDRLSEKVGGLVGPPWCGKPSTLSPSTIIWSLLGHLLTPDHAGLASQRVWLKMWVLRGVGVACFVGVAFLRA